MDEEAGVTISLRVSSAAPAVNSSSKLIKTIETKRYSSLGWGEYTPATVTNMTLSTAGALQDPTCGNLTWDLMTCVELHPLFCWRLSG